MTPPLTHTGSERDALYAAIVRLRARVMALVFGMVGGVGLFLATVWLLILGGEDVGAHLGLLGNYLPGYTVTWWGAFTGFGYGALIGALIGRAVARVYNQVASHRSSD